MLGLCALSCRCLQGKQVTGALSAKDVVIAETDDIDAVSAETDDNATCSALSCSAFVFDMHVGR